MPLLVPFISRRILTKTVPNWLKTRVTAASRARSSLASGRLLSLSVSVVRGRNRKICKDGWAGKKKDDLDLLGDKDAGSGRIDDLGVNITDLMAS